MKYNLETWTEPKANQTKPNRTINMIFHPLWTKIPNDQKTNNISLSAAFHIVSELFHMNDRKKKKILTAFGKIYISQNVNSTDFHQKYENRNLR